eukprot:m.162472 g.162472  ORF g.162472 m.162472 type:complete len:76 (+) comp15203_c1_seq5:202-429(+)
MDESDRDEESEQLRAAMHHAVSQIVRERSTEENVTYSKEFIAVLAELASSHLKNISSDLEMFARFDDAGMERDQL